MKAAILAVGSELLGTDRLDTDSLHITKVLERYGAELRVGILSLVGLAAAIVARGPA
jgi:molybdopterin-biosynthesis enzyme MoeA-like protein